MESPRNGPTRYSVISNPGDPQTHFTLTKLELVDLVSMAQERNFAEELDFLEQKGGLGYLEVTIVKDPKTGMRTDFHEGLAAKDDLGVREHLFGHNRPRIKELKSFLALIIQSLEDFTLRILLVASLVSIVIQVSTEEEHRSTAWVEGFAIFVAVMVCALVTAGNDYQKERQFQKLNQIATDRKTLTVFRGGATLNLHSSLVLVGDVVQVFEGMEIPADCLVLEAAELTTDESVMTCESDPMKKNTFIRCVEHRNRVIEEGNQNTSSRHEVPSPIMMSGTTVLTGEGKMVVLVVGEYSCVGKIKALIEQDDDEATPLQLKLEAIAHDIGKFGLGSAIVILLVLLVRFTIVHAVEESFEGKDVAELLGYFIIGITVVVVAIPEGLPLAVTLSLAYSTKRMLKDNNLVRKMAACETMGGASMICSDKTGTLTQNKMTLVKFWNEQTHEIDLYSNSIKLESYVSETLQELFLQSSIANGTAMLRPEIKGSNTEVALLQFIERCGFDYEVVRKQNSVSKSIPFSSQRKRMSLILNLEGGQQRIVTKGASELILESCSYFYSQLAGKVVLIDSFLRERIEIAIEQLASSALRTIGLAYRDLTGFEDVTTKDTKGVYQIECVGLTFIGILGIKDILRQEVPNAVAQCRGAGIKVRMVTGDNKITAKAIALECGIIKADDDQSLVMEGPEFMKEIGGVVCTACQTMLCDCPRDQATAKRLSKTVRVDTIKNGKRFDEIYPHLDVLARSRPEDKYALVTGLIERGHVVAVTGDGTNDAPALKKADVGFAMGKSGTEVAREASAIILLDDNFNSILLAVMWGRNIYDSIKKFLQFQLTVNVVAVVLTFIGALVLKQEVLKPIQMLWINLIMDTFASLALATETPAPDLLLRKPHVRNEYIVSKKMFKHIIGQAIYQSVIMLILLFSGDTYLPEYEGDEDRSSKYEHESKIMLQYKYSDTFMTPLGGICPDYSNYCTTMASGRFLHPGGHKEYLTFYEITHIPSRHYTVLFNVFVMMQLFNFLNARRIFDEFNVFDRMSTNLFFPAIMLIILVTQILIVTFGSIAFFCYPFFGLRIQHWLICIGFGSGSLLWSIIIKVVPATGSVEIRQVERDPNVPSQVLQLKRKGTDRMAGQFRSQNSRTSKEDARQLLKSAGSQRKIEYQEIKVDKQDLSYNSFEVR